jgi:hypothetical protein
MKKYPLLLLFLAAGGLLLGAAGDKRITVPRGETRQAAINAFNAQLSVQGKLAESIFLLGGSLRLDGEVTGDVICIGARVEIAETALIRRDLIVIGGRLDKAEQSRVYGEVYNIRTHSDLKKIAGSLLPFLPESGGMTFFKVIKIFFWLVLSLLTLAIFPLQVNQAAAMIPASPLRHLGRGLLALLFFLLLLLGFLLLSFILIGIPLLIMLMAAYFLVLIFGRAAIFYFIGDRACRGLRLKGNPALFIVLGVAAYTLLKFIPYLGGGLLVLLDLLAAGIGVGFFLRRRKSLA